MLQVPRGLEYGLTEGTFGLPGSQDKERIWKRGRRCFFDGVYKKSARCPNTITESMMFGKGRPEHWIDKRNEIPAVSPGDKCYQVPEYSKDFYKLGSTRPLAIYSLPRTVLSIDFPVPLKRIPIDHTQCFREKERRRRVLEDIKDVRSLGNWTSATPLHLTLPPVEDNLSTVTSTIDTRKSAHVNMNTSKPSGFDNRNFNSCRRPSSSSSTPKLKKGFSAH